MMKQQLEKDILEEMRELAVKTIGQHIDVCDTISIVRASSKKELKKILKKIQIKNHESN